MSAHPGRRSIVVVAVAFLAGTSIVAELGE
jgi:hypothetical protein